MDDQTVEREAPVDPDEAVRDELRALHQCDRGRRAGLRQGAQLPAGRKARFLTLARWAAAVLSLTLLAGCGLGETSSPAPSSAGSPSAPSGPSAAPVGTPAGAADWPTYH